MIDSAAGPFRLRTVNHVGIAVADLDVSIRFYRTLTGEDPRATGEADSEGLGRAMGTDRVVLRWATIRMANLNLDLLEFERPAPASEAASIHDRGALHLCFEVEDVAEVHARLVDAGVAFDGPVHVAEANEDGSAMVLAYFTGPDGEHLELMRPVGAFVRREAER